MMLLNNRKIYFLSFLGILIGCLFGLGLSGCIISNHPVQPGRYTDMSATPEKFSVCHGYGCKYQTPASLAKSQWSKVTSQFHPPATNPEMERRQIAAAIAKMEQLTGEAVGTQTDTGEGGFIRADAWQLDCIDETINTSLYLKFLERDGVLRWHKTAASAHRGYFVNLKWPHNTATVVDKTTGQRYAVDSWFFDNGKEPAIVPVEQWLDGWRP